MQFSASTCDGNGNCKSVDATSCAPFACGATACKTSCSRDGDCAAGNFCLLEKCVQVTAIATGGSHTCALVSGGGLECWGLNNNGQLGNGSTGSSDVPVAVTGLSSGIVAVSSGTNHTCAVTTGGALLCWGDNASGQLGNNSTADSLVPVAVSGLSSGVAAVSAGNLNTCAVTTGGAVWCWGDNESGQLGNGALSQMPSLVPVAAVSVLASDIDAITLGSHHACALAIGGAVYCWGLGLDGELGNGSTSSSPVPVAVHGLGGGVDAIAAGDFHTCAASGGVHCWGQNQHGELGIGSMNEDASMKESAVPVAVTGLSSGIASITAGLAYSCALTTGGPVWCWGDNTFGQLGNNSTTPSNVPIQVVGLSSGIAAVGGGDESTCALTSVSSVLCWGGNESGELGDDSTVESSLPANVVEP